MADLGPPRRISTRPQSGRSAGPPSDQPPPRKMHPVLIFLILFVIPIGLVIYTVINVLHKKEEAKPRQISISVTK